VERGWDEVAVEDIAAAANVSERTFRNYFTSKAEAVAASHLERALVVADELRAQPAAGPLWPASSHAARKSLSVAPSSPRHEGHMERVKLVLAHPSLHAELLRADDIAKDELAAAIADRQGLDAERDLFRSWRRPVADRGHRHRHAALDGQRPGRIGDRGAGTSLHGNRPGTARAGGES